MENPYDAKIKRNYELRDLWDILNKEFPELTPYSGSIVIRCRNFDDVGQARRRLRELFGRWEDVLDTIWESDGKGLASWNGKNEPIEIWLETPLKDFPSDKFSNGKKCQWVPQTQDYHRFVCKKEDS